MIDHQTDVNVIYLYIYLQNGNSDTALLDVPEVLAGQHDSCTPLLRSAPATSQVDAEVYTLKRRYSTAILIHSF